MKSVGRFSHAMNEEAVEGGIDLRDAGVGSLEEEAVGGDRPMKILQRCEAV